jgi:EKC/KEOPS complex subunit PCC1/LAGE3
MATNTCCSALDVPFPTARLASIALKSIQVDKELSPLVHRSFAVANPTHAGAEDGSVLHVEYSATTNRMLRVAVNSFMDSLALVIEVMEHLDVDVLETGAPDNAWLRSTRASRERKYT